MDDKLYRLLKAVAIVLGLATVGYMVYGNFFLQKAPGQRTFEAAGRLFEDRQYPRALEEYEKSISLNPDLPGAYTGKALALMQLERFDEALAAFDQAIAVSPVGINYANRGILFDRMGEHEKALADYERALAMDPKLADGPNWLTRFLRNQPEKPPTIADRAAYLREELAKPEADRLLRVPEIDTQQRPYKK